MSKAMALAQPQTASHPAIDATDAVRLVAKARPRKGVMSDATRAKIAAKLMGNSHALGCRKTLSVRAKIATALLGNLNCFGRKDSPETRAKKSAALKARPNPNKGKTWTEIMVSSARRLKHANKARVARTALEELKARGIPIVPPPASGVHGLGPDYRTDRLVFFYGGD